VPNAPAAEATERPDLSLTTPGDTNTNAEVPLVVPAVEAKASDPAISGGPPKAFTKLETSDDSSPEGKAAVTTRTLDFADKQVKGATKPPTALASPSKSKTSVVKAATPALTPAPAPAPALASALFDANGESTATTDVARPEPSTKIAATPAPNNGISIVAGTST
jgi:hypothetical protein